MSLNIGLVSAWNLATNSNDSIGSNNGSDSNISYSGGKAVFNGSNSKITLSSSNLIPAGSAQAFTFALVVNSNVASTVAEYRTALNFLYGMQFNWSWADAGLDVASGFLVQSAYYGTGVHNLSASTDYDIVFSYDGNVLNFYVNASLIGTATIGAKTRDSSGGNYFGCNQNGNSNWWYGSICKVVLWNVALTQEDVTKRYNGGSVLSAPFSSDFSASPQMHHQAISGGLM